MCLIKTYDWMVLCFMINFFVKAIDSLKQACSLSTFLKEKKTLVSVQVQKDFTGIPGS